MNNSFEYAVEVRNLTKWYKNGNNRLTVLNELDFSLKRGKSAVIMGKSGCGKSTFLHLLGGLDTPDAGNIIVAGNRVDSLSDEKKTRYRRTTVGFIFQMHYLLEDFTALENLVLTAMINGKSEREGEKLAKGLLDTVGLSERTDNYPGQLSGGERQRVAIARALVNDPEIILADEPTGNLDAENGGKIEKLLFELTREFQKSLILVTHDPLLNRFADYSYTLAEGKVRESE